MPDSGAGDIIGASYTFKILTTFSGTFTISGATTDNLLFGNLGILSTTAGKDDSFAPNGTDDHQIVADGATKGWVEGGVITLTCQAADVWFVTGMLSGIGDVATPFT